MINTHKLREMRKAGAFDGNSSLERLKMPLIALILTLLVIGGCTVCHAEEAHIEGYTLNEWAEAIHKAEGNDNYGILAHYKHTTYKQACINTVKHKYRDWLKAGSKGQFIHYLASKYAPIGSNTDIGTNKYWEKNVKYFLAKGGK